MKNKVIRRLFNSDTIERCYKPNRKKNGIKISPLPLQYFNSSECFHSEYNESAVFNSIMEHRFYIFSDEPVDVNSPNSSFGYCSIDWHKDFYSGFSFDPLKSSFKIPTNNGDGVDIKVPWELARMHHLPQLALYGIFHNEFYDSAKQEFLNEIKDFLKSNPFLRGIHWVSPMEVAIRASNIIVAYSILSLYDSFSKSDASLITDFIMDCYRFIYNNLEVNIKNEINGNHYLANLCGLLFISSVIDNNTVRSNIPFLVNELQNEAKKQFFEDGGGYEFSTTYTRFSAEMVAYSLALIRYLGYYPDKEVINKVSNIKFFLNSVYRPSGNILQIGDNDNGMFLDLVPRNDVYSILKTKNAIEAIDGLFGRGNSLFSVFVQSLLGNKYYFEEIHNQFVYSAKSVPTYEEKYVSEIIIPFHVDCLDHGPIVFPYFGLVIFGDSKKLYIRIPVSSLTGKSAHAHNDYLHFEYADENTDYYADQGSSFYNPYRNIRDFMRSSFAHNVPILNRKLVRFNGLWGIEEFFIGACSKIGFNEIVMWLSSSNMVFVRKITIFQNEVVIKDSSNEYFQSKLTPPRYFSPGYGLLYDDKKREISHDCLLELNKTVLEEIQ